MLATVMNCIYTSEIFRSQGMMTSVLTPMEIGGVTKLFSKDRRNKYLHTTWSCSSRGGTGSPYFSTDTATVLRAIEIDADDLLLAKAVDGVYDSDPKEQSGREGSTMRFRFRKVIEKQLQVVDMTASILAKENRMPMVVFGLDGEDSIVNAAHGKITGTRVTV
jgi:uridylate kinase